MREMPNAAKLVGAISFALTAWLAAAAFTPQIPEGMPATWFKESSAVIGVLVGWFVLGRAMGKGYAKAPGRGVTTVIVLYFWLLFAFSFREMILRSLEKRYRGPMDALTSMVDIGLFFGKLSMHVETLATLFLCGVASGLLTEFAKRTWR